MTKPRDYDETNRKLLRVTRNGRKQLLSSAVTPSQPPLPILPDQLTREILLRLPARSLLRLQSVCSSWRTLISSSQFANDHVRRSIVADPCLSGPRAFYHHHWLFQYKRFGDFSVRSLLENPSKPTEAVQFEGRTWYKITGSCNGLLCLHEFATNRTTRAILWNPCTGLASESLEIGGRLWVSGFGYDHVNDKYKLVEIVDHMRENTTRIYTFCRNPSKRAIQQSPFSSIKGGGKGLFVPGTATLNWIRSHSTLDCLVLSLDLVNETFTEFSLPPKDQDNKTFIVPQLCLLRNCLAFCFNHHEKTHWSVWVMKEYGVPQSWTKFAVIPCHPRLSGEHLHPLGIWRNVIMAVASSSKLVLYNLDKDSFEFPVLKSSSSSNSTGLYVQIYHESLVSPSYGGLQSSSSQIWLIKPAVDPHNFSLSIVC